MSRLRALLATLRIANAPSVVSNVWLGYVVGCMAWSDPLFSADAGFRQVAPFLAGLCLYFAGNLANDWFDRDWDHDRRPERALPSGQFQPAAYLAAALLIGSLGLLLAFNTGRWPGVAALFIAGFIALYTWTHKRSPWSVIPMGLCRAGLYLLGYASCATISEEIAHPPRNAVQGEYAILLTGMLICLCSGLLAYIAGLSMSARYESMAEPPRRPLMISRALLVYPLLAMPCVIFLLAQPWGWLGMIPYGIWLALCLTRYRRPIPSHVSALLAGIPLVDALLLLPIAALSKADGFFGPDAHWWIGGIPLVAFILGRLLQKVAPAT